MLKNQIPTTINIPYTGNGKLDPMKISERTLLGPTKEARSQKNPSPLLSCTWNGSDYHP